MGKWEVSYPELPAQFALAGIDPAGPNHWNKVYDFSPNPEGKEHWSFLSDQARQYVGVQLGCVGLQLGCVGLQPGCVGLQLGYQDKRVAGCREVHALVRMSVLCARSRRSRQMARWCIACVVRGDEIGEIARLEAVRSAFGRELIRRHRRHRFAWHLREGRFPRTQSAAPSRRVGLWSDGRLRAL